MRASRALLGRHWLVFLAMVALATAIAVVYGRLLPTQASDGPDMALQVWAGTSYDGNSLCDTLDVGECTVQGEPGQTFTVGVVTNGTPETYYAYRAFLQFADLAFSPQDGLNENDWPDSPGCVEGDEIETANSYTIHCYEEQVPSGGATITSDFSGLLADMRFVCHGPAGKVDLIADPAAYPSSSAYESDYYKGLAYIKSPDTVHIECTEPMPTDTPSPTATFTPSPTHTPTVTPTSTTPTLPPTHTPTTAPTHTPTNTPTATATLTPSSTPTPTNIPIGTAPLPRSLTPAPTATLTPSVTPTFTITPSATRSATATRTPTATRSPTPTASRTPTAESEVMAANTQPPPVVFVAGQQPAQTSAPTRTATPLPTATKAKPTSEILGATAEPTQPTPDGNGSAQGSGGGSDNAQAVGGGGGAAPATTAKLTAPDEISTSSKNILTNLLLAIILLLTLLWSSSVFNDTMSENRTDMEEGLARLTGPFRGIIGGVGALVAGLPLFLTRTLGPPILVLVSAGVSVLQDPDVGWNATTFVLLLSFIATIVITTYIIEGGEALVTHRRFDIPAGVRLVPFAVLIAVSFVLISRLIDFPAPIVYGFVASATVLAANALTKKQSAQAVAVPAATMLAISMAAWALLVPLRGASGDSNHWYVQVPTATASAVFAGGIIGLLFTLLPLNFSDGGKIMRWNRLVWLALFGVPLFMFCWVILNPQAVALDAMLEGRVIFCVSVVALYALTVAAIWAYFHYHNVQETDAGPDEPPLGSEPIQALGPLGPLATDAPQVGIGEPLVHTSGSGALGAQGFTPQLQPLDAAGGGTGLSP